MITSKNNPTYKMLKSLQSKKGRQMHQCYFIEGKRFVQEALLYAADEIVYIVVPDDEDAHVLESMLTKSMLPEQVLSEQVLPKSMLPEQRLSKPMLPEQILPELMGHMHGDSSKAFEKILTLSKHLFYEICDTENPQPIGAVMRMRSQNKQEMLVSDVLKSKKRFVILDGLQDPGNVGTVIRTTDAAGFDAVVLSEHCVDVYNAKVLRATMGAMFRLSVVKTDCIAMMIDRLKQNGVRIYAGVLDGAVSLFDVAFHKKTAIVLGNEGNGISTELLDMADVHVKIPMQEHAESLNVSVAASLLIYEVFRKI